MASGINLPKGVVLERGIYVRRQPGGMSSPLGISIKEARENLRFMTKVKVGPPRPLALPIAISEVWPLVNPLGADQCWPWLGKVDADGYAHLRGHRVNRLIAGRKAGRPLYEDEVAMHSCDNPSCCNPSHIKIGTQLENILDRCAKDRSAAGIKNGRAKLTPEIVSSMRESSTSMQTLASIHGVDKSTVRAVLARKTWRKVP